MLLAFCYVSNTDPGPLNGQQTEQQNRQRHEYRPRSNQYCTIFYPILLFCLMFLIGAIKPIVEKKFNTCFIFLRDCLGEVS